MKKVNDSENPLWSPIEEERKMQEKQFKNLYPQFPNDVMWQMFNGVLYFANKYFDAFGRSYPDGSQSEGSVKPILDKLFEEIKHGDEEHQKWLKDKIDEFYNKLI